MSGLIIELIARLLYFEDQTIIKTLLFLRAVVKYKNKWLPQVKKWSGQKL